MADALRERGAVNRLTPHRPVLQRVFSRVASFAALLVLPLLAACIDGDDHPTAPAVPPVPTETLAMTAPAPASELARGSYLATLGNCAGCHTAPGGAAYAGGRGLPTPFGTVFAGNLTPDRRTGLGLWSADDFWRALHHGRSRDGRRLLPAFPYTSFTHVRRADSDALHAYLRSLPAVASPSPTHRLRFPYNTQAALALWQWLYFTPAADSPAAAGTAGANDATARGAYLVKGLGHCAACHAPRNLLGAPAGELSGAEMPAQAWYAPALHPSADKPVSQEELVQLLRVGQSGRDTVSGPMASVVFRSTQHWAPQDLQAVAAYLTSLNPLPPRVAPASAPATVMARGQRLYDQRCADCHGDQGQGKAGAYPALAGNRTVLQPTARNLVQVMHHGGFAPATAGNPRPYGMPHQGLTPAEMAAVASFVRQSWGNQASALDEVQAARLRGGPTP